MIRRVLLPALVLLAVPLTARPLSAEVPEALEELVFGDEKRETAVVEIDGIRYSALRRLGSIPALVWPLDPEAALFDPDDLPALRDRLADAADDLGVGGFEPRFRERYRWRDNTVLAFDLVRDDAPLDDARLELHFADGRFLGLLNHVPGEIRAIVDPGPELAEEEIAYLPVRRDVGVFDAVAARVVRERRDDRLVVRIVTPDGEHAETTERPDPVPEQVRPAPIFDEFPVPVGFFPDQVALGDGGLVWISQPNNDYLTAFDPETGLFSQLDTSPGSGPDGLASDSKGRLWSGMYYSASLGRFDPATRTAWDYPAPYAGAFMAIPVESSDGSIWVTDHLANRFSEFDPDTETWIRSIVMPTPACWVVQGWEDTDRNDLYFTEYDADQLGRIAVGSDTVTDIPVPGGGPAFCAYSDGAVYYSRWLESGIGCYDVATGTITEYDFPVANEYGGPLWRHPNGDIVIGTLNRGYIMVFDLDTRAFAAYEIPTAFPGLKDGLIVADDGVIWFTESNANKLGRLELGRRTPISP